MNSTKGIILGLRYPEEDIVTVEQIEYINNKLKKVEQDAYNGIIYYIDFQSLNKYLFVQELCGNLKHFLVHTRLKKEMMKKYILDHYGILIFLLIIMKEFNLL